MRVFINREPVVGPWGGGNRLLVALVACLRRRGHDVVHVLDATCDAALCLDPRQGNKQGLLDHAAIFSFVRAVMQTGKRIPIIQRVGDIGSHGKPDLTKMVLASAPYSDRVIFPSDWAMGWVQDELFRRAVRQERQWSVVRNAPVASFYRDRRVQRQLPSSLRFVTHHWSDNALKGFGFYQELDAWCRANGHTFTFIGRRPFTFIGCRPPDIELSHSRSVMDEQELCAELPRHDIYVSASLAEAGANHVLEAVACGLPVIYHAQGGSTAEYCLRFGTSFDGTLPSFEQALAGIRASWDRLSTNLKNARKELRAMEDVAERYADIIEGARV